MSKHTVLVRKLQIVALISAAALVLAGCWQPLGDEASGSPPVNVADEQGSALTIAGSTTDLSGLYGKDWGVSQGVHVISVYLESDDYMDGDGTGVYIELFFEHDGQVVGESIEELVANADWSFYYTQALVNVDQYEPGLFDTWESPIERSDAVVISVSNEVFAVAGEVEVTLQGQPPGSPETKELASFSFAGPMNGTYQ